LVRQYGFGVGNHPSFLRHDGQRVTEYYDIDPRVTSVISAPINKAGFLIPAPCGSCKCRYSNEICDCTVNCLDCAETNQVAELSRN